MECETQTDIIRGVITVRVLLFAVFREAVGTRSLEMQVPEGSTLDSLYRHIEDRHPGLRALRPYTTFAVNREVQAANTVLQSGDEVAFLQPVSGGSDD